MSTPEVITLGCRLNIAESERMRAMLADAGNVVVVSVGAQSCGNLPSRCLRCRRVNGHETLTMARFENQQMIGDDRRTDDARLAWLRPDQTVSIHLSKNRARSRTLRLGIASFALLLLSFFFLSPPTHHHVPYSCKFSTAAVVVTIREESKK